MDEFIVIDPRFLNYLEGNIEFNFLLILFTMSCSVGLFCCKSRSENNKYIIVPSEETVEGQLVADKV